MTRSRRARITRRPTAPPLEGVIAVTLDGILAALAERKIAHPVYADLSLGAWRSHEVARSCFSQLGLEWPPQDAPSGNDETAAIGDWIDAEGCGEASALQAVALAEALYGELGERPLRLVVLAPRFDLPWQAENLAFIRFLAHGRRPCDRIVLTTAETRAPRSPGLDVDWNEAAEAPPRPRPDGLEPLIPGFSGSLTPPEWRRAPSTTPRLEFDRLAAAAAEPWLRAYAQVYGNNIFVDPWFLCAEANRRLAEGGHGIALRLLERAAECARTPQDRGLLQSLAQGFRIALMRYEEVMGAPDSVSLAGMRGKVVVLNFWASWCLECRDEHAVLQEAAAQYMPQGVKFYGVLYNDNAANGQEYLTEMGGQVYPTLLDPKTRTAIDYGVYGVPETFFIAPDGRVAFKKVGPITPQEMDATLKPLLAEAQMAPQKGGS